MGLQVTFIGMSATANSPSTQYSYDVVNYFILNISASKLLASVDIIEALEAKAVPKAPKPVLLLTARTGNKF